MDVFNFSFCCKGILDRKTPVHHRCTDRGAEDPAFRVRKSTASNFAEASRHAPLTDRRAARRGASLIHTCLSMLVGALLMRTPLEIWTIKGFITNKVPTITVNQLHNLIQVFAKQAPTRETGLAQTHGLRSKAEYKKAEETNPTQHFCLPTKMPLVQHMFRVLREVLAT